MNTIDIVKLLGGLSKFKGVYPADKIPTPSKLPFGVIVNTDPSTKPGTHWVAIWINRNGYGEYFDSFGLPPLTPQIYEYLEEYTTRWNYNKCAIQSTLPTSIACGYFAVFYILHKIENQPLEYICNYFVKNNEINDKLVIGAIKFLNNFN